jgi:hypothetical protein
VRSGGLLAARADAAQHGALQSAARDVFVALVRVDALLAAASGSARAERAWCVRACVCECDCVWSASYRWRARHEHGEALLEAAAALLDTSYFVEGTRWLSMLVLCDVCVQRHASC